MRGSNRSRTNGLLRSAALRSPLLGLVLLLPLSAACGQDEAPDMDAVDEDRSRLEAMPDTVPGRTFRSLEHGSDTVSVTLDDYSIDVPALLPPGRTVFRVTNRGREVHNFLVDRNGSRTGIDDGVEPGGTAHVTVDLEPGTYAVLCTVAGHDTRGMRETIEVPPAATPDDSLAGEGPGGEAS